MTLQALPTSGNSVVPAQDNFDVLEVSAVFGKDATTTTGLTWGYLSGRWGGIAISAGTVTLTNAATNHVVVARATGAVTTTTASTNWDNTTDYARLYKLTTAGNVVTAAEDHRSGPYGIFHPPTPSVNTTAVGNVTTGEDNLITFSMPAGTFSAAKKGAHITAWGTAANNANAKTLKLYFGTLAILAVSLTANQVCTWRIEADVYSTGTDAQDYVSQILQGGTATLVDVEVGSHTQDDGAAITIKCTGEATSTNDIVQEGLIVRYVG